MICVTHNSIKSFNKTLLKLERDNNFKIESVSLINKGNPEIGLFAIKKRATNNDENEEHTMNVKLFMSERNKIHPSLLKYFK